MSGALDCYRCGIIFHKFRPRPSNSPTIHSPSVPSSQTLAGHRPQSFVLDYLLPVPEGLNWPLFAWRVCVMLLICCGTVYFASFSIEDGDIGRTFMHLVNLAFHEGGHVLFRPLGRFMTVLGGSISQLVIPAACLGFFVIQHRNAVGGAFSIWWLGQSLVDLAPYIRDASAQKLVLLGGFTGQDVPGAHDWNYILSSLNLLHLDGLFGHGAYVLGVVLMVVGVGWGIAAMRVQYLDLSTHTD